MSVKIEVVRESVGQERLSRPWSVRDGVCGDSWAVDSNGRYVTSAVSREQARAVVDAVNNLPASKGKIEKFVVEMDPETFRRLAAIAGYAAGDPVREFAESARAHINLKCDTRFCDRTFGTLVEVDRALDCVSLKEDA